MLEIVTGEKIPRGQVLNTDKIGEFTLSRKMVTELTARRLHPALDDGRDQRTT